jgi:heme/copper-type cytochrome/quinol oxidase subunit 3
MSTAAAAAHAHELEKKVLGVTNGKFAMWLFLGSDGMSFMGLIATYVALRIANLDIWPRPEELLNIPLTAVNTFILICSSLTMVKAYVAAQEGNVGQLKKHITLTMLGGALFLGVQVYEYQHLIFAQGVTLWTMPEGFEGSTPLFAATFYACTCFHGFHVLSGVLYLGAILVGIHRGSWTVNRIEIVGLYWHFVDLVWIIIFTIIYLI